jgi:hypothetical protein
MTTIDHVLKNRDKRSPVAIIDPHTRVRNTPVYFDPAKAEKIVGNNPRKPRHLQTPKPTKTEVKPTTEVKPEVKTEIVPEVKTSQASAKPYLVSKFSGGLGWHEDDLMITDCEIYGIALIGSSLKKGTIYILKNSDGVTVPTSDASNVIAMINVSEDYAKPIAKTIIVNESLVLENDIKLQWISMDSTRHKCKRDDRIRLYSEDLTKIELHLYVI